MEFSKAWKKEKELRAQSGPARATLGGEVAQVHTGPASQASPRGPTRGARIFAKSALHFF